jgi:hypothetical protein
MPVPTITCGKARGLTHHLVTLCTEKVAPPLMEPRTRTSPAERDIETETESRTETDTGTERDIGTQIEAVKAEQKGKRISLRKCVNAMQAMRDQKVTSTHFSFQERALHPAVLGRVSVLRICIFSVFIKNTKAKSTLLVLIKLKKNKKRQRPSERCFGVEKEKSLSLTEYMWEHMHLSFPVVSLFP